MQIRSSKTICYKRRIILNKRKIVKTYKLTTPYQVKKLNRNNQLLQREAPKLPHLNADIFVHAVHNSPKLLFHHGARHHVNRHVEICWLEVVRHLSKRLQIILSGCLIRNGNDKTNQGMMLLVAFFQNWPMITPVAPFRILQDCMLSKEIINWSANKASWVSKSLITEHSSRKRLTVQTTYRQLQTASPVQIQSAHAVCWRHRRRIWDISNLSSEFQLAVVWDNKCDGRRRIRRTSTEDPRYLRGNTLCKKSFRSSLHP